jgi:peroxiredoxin
MTFISATALLCIASALSAGAEIVVKLKPLTEGASKKGNIGYYSPQAVILGKEQPATLSKAPAGLVAPLYATLPIGGTLESSSAKPVYHIVVDEPEDQDARLWVDANGNGDLTDDPPAEWVAKPLPASDGKTLRQYSGGASVVLRLGSGPVPARLGMYRFSKHDPARQQHKDKLLYYRDYAMQGELTLDGKSYRAMLSDELVRGDFRGDAPQVGSDKPSGVYLLVDLDGNEAFDSRGERFDVRSPLVIKDAAYEIKDLPPDGGEFKLVRASKQPVARVAPAQITPGQKAKEFEATTMDGKRVRFPSDYKGKLVMLDFWATWCRPCMMEVPGLVSAYEKFHSKGFEVLGISLDGMGQSDKLRASLEKNGMTWPQVHDGKVWKADVAQLYGVTGIPAAWLVDGDTGEILANSQGLRGAALAATLETQLARKFPIERKTETGEKPEISP